MSHRAHASLTSRPAPSVASHRGTPLPSRLLQAGWLFALLLYLGTALWQLGLPGLHYDEAREAGQNAMELLTGAPVMAFRGVALELFGLRLPLMVQEYIGALNVYLALPSLWLTGIGVPNLRVLGVLTGAAALILLERAVTVWMSGAPAAAAERRARLPLSGAGVAAMLLLCSAPSFVFWSRQGVFVTNLTQPLVLLMIWQGLLWRRNGQPAALHWAALGAGLALYAKLLALWVVLPFALLLAGDWLFGRRPGRAQISWRTVAGALGCLLLPLAPLLLFNLQTGGSLLSLGGRLGTSYYGVDNAAWSANLLVRLGQLAQLLRGDHFWYLGGVYGNRAAPGLAAGAVAGGLIANWRRVAPPLLLVAAFVLLSTVTPSDLFITHFALAAPLLAGTVAIAGATLVAAAQRAAPQAGRVARGLAALALVLWLALDVTAAWRTHGALARSGGLADHSDASYDLAAFLRGNGYGAPIALDWGMDATVRFLSEGAVTPIEIFGYESPAAPDADFAERLAPYLARADAVFLLRAEGNEVFAGRRERFEAEAATLGAMPELVERFAQRDGVPLYELWRLARP